MRSGNSHPAEGYGVPTIGADASTVGRASGGAVGLRHQREGRLDLLRSKGRRTPARRMARSGNALPVRGHLFAQRFEHGLSGGAVGPHGSRSQRSPEDSNLHRGIIIGSRVASSTQVNSSALSSRTKPSPAAAPATSTDYPNHVVAECSRSLHPLRPLEQGERPPVTMLITRTASWYGVLCSPFAANITFRSCVSETHLYEIRSPLRSARVCVSTGQGR